jgi:Zn finger protein HypA/HybF involved in hydrogenase expression
MERQEWTIVCKHCSHLFSRVVTIYPNITDCPKCGKELIVVLGAKSFKRAEWIPLDK